MPHLKSDYDKKIRIRLLAYSFVLKLLEISNSLNIVKGLPEILL